ncbi:MAG: hypothetical protein BroJett040_06060 [Oligoflexia bacterium]|nr:MAG: hypothetical protein BroJett040_06060 [Oligoflexia bacterium]
MSRFKSFEVYRILFPLGVLFGLLGGLLGGLFGEAKPQLHRHLMTFGFLINFAMGYLFTALPRMTGRGQPEEGIKFSLLTLITLSSIFVWMKDPTIFYLNQSLLGVLLMIYLFTQVRIDQVRGSHCFLYLSALMMIFSSFSLARQIPLFTYSAHLIFHEGIILALIIGVGTRMIPTILGQMTLDRKESISILNYPQIWWALAGLFGVSYFLEDTTFQLWGHLYRAMLVSFIGFHYWKMHRQPIRLTAFYFFILISIWILCLGVWLQAIKLFDPMISRHLISVSGMGLLTLMISVRIVLGHGNYPLSHIEESKDLFWMGLFCLVAAVLRSFSFIPLYWAAGAWLISLLFWIKFLFPKVLKIQGRGF